MVKKLTELGADMFVSNSRRAGQTFKRQTGGQNIQNSGRQTKVLKAKADARRATGGYGENQVRGGGRM